MSETSRSQMHNEFWTKSVDESTARFVTMMDEAAKMQAKAVEQATRAIEESARLQRETLSYGMELAAQWRKLSLEAVQRASEAMKTQA